MRTHRTHAPWHRLSSLWFLVVSVCAFAGPDSRVGGPKPGEPIPRELEGIDVTEHLTQPVDLSLTFLDEEGRTVALKDYFHAGRPVILNLIYYTCPGLCDLILNGQVAALREIPWTPGKEFEVVTVSIDPQETFAIAAQKKVTYLNTYGRPAPGWHFLADRENHAKTLSEQIGYHYRYDRKQAQFAHPSAIMILTPEGKIARYLYGVRYRPFDVRFALTEAAEGRSTLTVEKILLWCYHYDPQTNRYVLFASNVMRIGGAVTVLILAFFIWRMIRAERTRERMA